METQLHGKTEGLRELALTVFGLIVAVTPLILWVAWSRTLFVSVLLASAGALALIFVLARQARTQPGVRAADGAHGRRADVAQ